MKVPIWLKTEAVLEMHQMMLELYGGSAGLRDFGLLDSALHRPKFILEYEPASTLERLAAAYAGGIIKNHPFVDGNKRCGFLAAFTFLDINGKELRATEAEAASATIALAAGELAEEEYAAWLGDNCVQLREDAQP